MTQIFKFLRNTSNSEEMSVDGSSTAVIFSISPGANVSWDVYRCSIHIVDASVSHGDFGGIASGITNGIKVEVLDGDDNQLFDFTDDFTIKTNGQWGHLAGIDVFIQTTAGDDLLIVRWTINRSGEPLRLNGTDKLAFTVQDDLTPLTHMAVMTQGRVVEG